MTDPTRDPANPVALPSNNQQASSAERRTRLTLRLLLGVAIALVLAGLLYWRLVPDAPPPPPLPDQSAIGAPLTLESAAPIARTQAERWLPDARLLNESMQIDWPDPPSAVPELPSGGWITFVFVGPWSAFGRNEQAASFSLLLDRLSGTIVQQSSLGWETPPPLLATPAAATPVAERRVSSAAAALIAEAAGGSAYRAECPDVRHVSRVIRSALLPGEWVVIYEDARRPERHGFLVSIDASTGKQLEIRRDDLPCPTG